MLLSSTKSRKYLLLLSMSCLCVWVCVCVCVCVLACMRACMHACDMFHYNYKHSTLFCSMSLGGGIDQALLDALEAAYKDVRFLCLPVCS